MAGKYKPSGDGRITVQLQFPDTMVSEDGVKTVDVRKLLIEGALKSGVSADQFSKLPQDALEREKLARKAIANAVLQLGFQGHRQARDEDLNDLINAVSEVAKAENAEPLVEE